MKAPSILLAALLQFGALASYADVGTNCIDADAGKTTRIAQPPPTAKPVDTPVAGCPCRNQSNVCSCKKTSSIAAQPISINLTCPTSPVVASMPVLLPIVANVQPKNGITAPNPPAPKPPVKPNETIDAAYWLKLGAVAVELLIVIGLLIFGLGLLNARTLEKATDGLTFRRYWGGFGGEGSGWQMSAPLSRCLAGLLLISLGAGLTVQAISAITAIQKESSQQSTTSNDEPAAAAAEEAKEVLQIDQPVPPTGATTAANSTGQ